VNALSEAARDLKIAIVIGANERVDAGPGNGTLYNALLTISEDGRLANHHRKLIPTYTERLVWGNGDGRGLEAVPTSSGTRWWIDLLGALDAARAHGHAQFRRAHSLGGMGRRFMNYISWPADTYAFEGRCFCLGRGLDDAD